MKGGWAAGSCPRGQRRAQCWPSTEHAPARAAAPAPQKKKAGLSDFWYDVMGWGCLVGLAFGLVLLQQRAAPAAAAAAK